MTPLITEIVSATGKLEAAILDITDAGQATIDRSKSMRAKAKLLPQALVKHYPELSWIERELRGVFEACSDAIDRKTVNPVVARAAISIADEYRQVIDAMKATNGLSRRLS